MKEVIVRLRQDCIKVKGGEYVQDIVRCKDCIYGKIREVDGKKQVYCDYQFDWWNMDGFCSYGARMTDSEIPNNCDTCKHNKLEWDSPKCDGCSKAHSNYEPQTERSE